jgi:hypothetical protein
VADDDTRHSWRPIDLLGLEDMPPIRPTVGGVLYPGGRHYFSAEHDSGKTFYAFALGLETIRAGGRVLHLDFEMFAARTRERLREMGATDDELAAWIHVEPEGPPFSGYIDELLTLKPTLAIVDAAAGAYDALGLDDNKRSDVERFARMIVTPLTRAGVASIVIDHVTKNRESRGRFAIGSERKIGGADVHLSFQAIKPLHRGGSGLFKITVAKDRFGFLPRPDVGELHLSSDPETHAIAWTLQEVAASDTQGDGWKPTALMERVSIFLAEQTKPLSKSDVQRGVRGKRPYVIKAIDELLADGYATAIDGPRGSKLISFAKPFRVPETFPDVPGTAGDSPVPAFPPPTRGNANGNASEDAEVERLVAKYGNGK